MASVIHAVSQLQQPDVRQQATSKQVVEPDRAAVTFVPTLVDLQTSVRQVRNALQWRRQLVDFFGNFISGAVSLR